MTLSISFVSDPHFVCEHHQYREERDAMIYGMNRYGVPMDSRGHSPFLFLSGTVLAPNIVTKSHREFYENIFSLFFWDYM